MKRLLIPAILLFFFLFDHTYASKGFSISLGTEYLPLSKVEFGNPAVNSYEIYDNMSVESGLYYCFEPGFRAGTIASFFNKNVDTGNSSSDLFSWGIGILGDFEFKISESGNTRLLLGTDTGFAKLRDSNDFSKRSDDSYWASFFGGIRYFFSSRYYFELDYRMKWQEFELIGAPVDKSFDFSGSSLRLSLGYGFFPDNSTAEGSE